MALITAMVKGAWWGLRLRCPQCRRGPIFRGRFAQRDACPECGYTFFAGRGEFTGALMLAQGALMVAAALGYVTVRATTDWDPLWVGLGLLAFLVLAPILLYPHLKGVWIGILHGSATAGT